MTSLEAPIVAVSVYPDRARITRRGTVRLEPGDQRVYVEPLPLGLAPDSVRVGGRGPATVLGVDVEMRHHPTTVDPAVAELEAERRTIEAELAALTDEDGVQAQLAQFLERLGQRAGGTYARSLANGSVEPDGLGAFTDSLGARLAAVKQRQRELTEAQQRAGERLAAVDRRLAELVPQRAPDRLAAAVSLDVTEAADVHLELSYVVGGAGWESSYDARLVDDRLTLTWYGLVRQHTGEDWPECELILSTARPADAASVPELDPWFLDRARPIEPPRPVPMRARGGPGVFAAAVMDTVEAAPYVAESVAVVEQGVAAATYRPARPVAVPADGLREP